MFTLRQSITVHSPHHLNELITEKTIPALMTPHIEQICLMFLEESSITISMYSPLNPIVFFYISYKAS